MPPPWQNAPALNVALREASQRWPKRKRHLDGTIGDEDHQARQSDHNPDERGIVHAVDITHDPDNGADCEKLAAFLVLRRDRRVRMMIWNRQQIFADDWTWKPYTGSKPHTTHMHISIKSTPEAENDTSPWWDANLLETALVKLELLSKKAEQQAEADARRREAELEELLASLRPVVQDALESIPFMPTMVWSTVPTEPPTGQPVPSPPGYRRLKSSPPREVVATASKVLKLGLKVGSYVTRIIKGKTYAFLIEWHKHAPTDPVPENLKKWHRGVSTFEKVP